MAELHYLDGKVPSYDEGQHEDAPGVYIPREQIVLNYCVFLFHVC